MPTKPAGMMEDESTENVHRFARKSPDTLLRLARSKEVIIPHGTVKNVYGEPVITHEKKQTNTPVRHGLSTAEAALGRVGRVGVGEHDEGVADRQVPRITRFREKGLNSPFKKS